MSEELEILISEQVSDTAATLELFSDGVLRIDVSTVQDVLTLNEDSALELAMNLIAAVRTLREM